MITKEQEYIADILKIAGFAFCAPFGKVILSYPYLRVADLIPNMKIKPTTRVILRSPVLCLQRAGRRRIPFLLA